MDALFMQTLPTYVLLVTARSKKTATFSDSRNWMMVWGQSYRNWNIDLVHGFHF